MKPGEIPAFRRLMHVASKAELDFVPGVQPETTSPWPIAPSIEAVSWREMANDPSEWNQLARIASEPNPFFESWYLLPSIAALEPADEVVILRYTEAGELRGLLPISWSNRYYCWPVPNITSWLHDNCFLGTPLVAKRSEVPFWRALLNWADKNARSALFLHLRELPIGGALQTALTTVAQSEGRQVELVHREERALLQSSLSADAYLEASLSTKKRKELRRQMKRLSEEGAVGFSCQTEADGLTEWIDTFLDLESSGWKGQAGSALDCDPTKIALFRESLTGATACNRLERLTLTLDDRPIAMLANFLTPPGAFGFKTAFDEDYSRFSPGVLLQKENLAMLEREGFEWCDSCASANHPMIDHIWRERRAIGRYSVAIGGTLRRAGFRQFVRAESARSSTGDGK